MTKLFGHHFLSLCVVGAKGLFSNPLGGLSHVDYRALGWQTFLFALFKGWVWNFLFWAIFAKLLEILIVTHLQPLS
jgi:hypothetical protein